MRIMNLSLEIRRKRPNWIKNTPVYTFDNLIDRDFLANKPNQKWFTYVCYLFYGNHKKAYISAIIDCYDMSIFSYVISECNDNQLVMETLKDALKNNPCATPIIHSDLGFQYTSNAYSHLEETCIK